VSWTRIGWFAHRRVIGTDNSIRRFRIGCKTDGRLNAGISCLGTPVLSRLADGDVSEAEFSKLATVSTWITTALPADRD